MSQPIWRPGIFATAKAFEIFGQLRCPREIDIRGAAGDSIADSVEGRRFQRNFSWSFRLHNFSLHLIRTEEFQHG